MSCTSYAIFTWLIVICILSFLLLFAHSAQDDPSCWRVFTFMAAIKAAPVFLFFSHIQPYPSLLDPFTLTLFQISSVKRLLLPLFLSFLFRVFSCFVSSDVIRYHWLIASSKHLSSFSTLVWTYCDTLLPVAYWIQSLVLPPSLEFRLYLDHFSGLSLPTIFSCADHRQRACRPFSLKSRQCMHRH